MASFQAIEYINNLVSVFIKTTKVRKISKGKNKNKEKSKKRKKDRDRDKDKDKNCNKKSKIEEKFQIDKFQIPIILDRNKLEDLNNQNLNLSKRMILLLGLIMNKVR